MSMETTKGPDAPPMDQEAAKAALQTWLAEAVKAEVAKALQGPPEEPEAKKAGKETKEEKRDRQIKEGAARRAAHHEENKTRRTHRNNAKDLQPVFPVAVPENKQVCWAGRGAPVPVTPPVPNFFPPSVSTPAVSGDCTVPVGGIILWSGTIAAITTTLSPTWQLCDGTNSTPDLRDRFVVGAKQDSGGIAKTNIEGTLAQTGGATGHSHSAHGNLSHSGFSISPHSGLTHGITISDHPSLTHNAIGAHAALSLGGMTHEVLSIPAVTFSIPGGTHPDRTIAALTHGSVVIPAMTHGSVAIPGMTHADVSVAARSDLSAASISHPSISIPSLTHSAHAILSLTVPTGAGTARTLVTGPSAAHPAHAATTLTIAGHPTLVVSHPAWTIQVSSHPTTSAPGPDSHAQQNIAGPADHPSTIISGAPDHASAVGTVPQQSFAISSHPVTTVEGFTHNAISDHPSMSHTASVADHGTGGSVTHSWSESAAHTISGHDTVSQVLPYFALAYIMRMQ